MEGLEFEEGAAHATEEEVTGVAKRHLFFFSSCLLLQQRRKDDGAVFWRVSFELAGGEGLREGGARWLGRWRRQRQQGRRKWPRFVSHNKGRKRVIVILLESESD